MNRQRDALDRLDWGDPTRPLEGSDRRAVFAAMDPATLAELVEAAPRKGQQGRAAFHALERALLRGSYRALCSFQSRLRHRQSGKRDRPFCGARCRDAHPCQARAVRGGSRCRQHGGANQADASALARHAAGREAERLGFVRSQVERWPAALMFARG